MTHSGDPARQTGTMGGHWFWELAQHGPSKETKEAGVINAPCGPELVNLPKGMDRTPHQDLKTSSVQ